MRENEGWAYISYIKSILRLAPYTSTQNVLWGLLSWIAGGSTAQLTDGSVILLLLLLLLSIYEDKTEVSAIDASVNTATNEPPAATSSEAHSVATDMNNSAIRNVSEMR